MVKPFIKRVGGKTQSLPQLKLNFPKSFLEGELVYVEPFVGWGAVLFWVLENIPNIKKVIISDLNKELINAYQVVKLYPSRLIKILNSYEKEYHNVLNDKNQRELYYYTKRKQYNLKNNGQIIQAALFIFLNKTCFNWLYRVNKNSEYNAAIGKPKKSTICNMDNLITVSRHLQKVEIYHDDFESSLKHIEANDKAFFYFDPPYKPLKKQTTSSLYNAESFCNEEQNRLKNYCQLLDSLGHYWLLSNSKAENDYFERLYSTYNVCSIKSKRMINRNTKGRGAIEELIIKNYN